MTLELPWRRTVVLLLVACVALSAGCGDDGGSEADNDSEVDQSRSLESENGQFLVMYSPSVEPIPFNQLFDMTVMVHDGEDHAQILMDAEISVEARMPAHGHGMLTDANVTKRDDGSFLVEGMKFHMRSNSPEERWEIVVDVDQNGTTDTAVFNVMCCEE